MSGRHTACLTARRYQSVNYSRREKRKPRRELVHLDFGEMSSLPVLPDLGQFIVESKMREVLVYQADIMHLANLLWQWELRFRYNLTCDIEKIIIAKDRFWRTYGIEELRRLSDYIVLQALKC